METAVTNHPVAYCPVCDDVCFVATSALVCNVDLYEHMRKAHPGLQRDDLDKAFAEAKRNFPYESESPPSLWKDRIPPTPVSKEPSDCYYFTAVCPECDTELVEMRSGTLVEMALAHVADRHSDLSPELRTQLCIAITDDRVLHKGDSREPKEIPAPEVSKGTVGAVKPPIGLQPEHLWREQRMYELIACINRYHESGFPVKPEWLEELRGLLVGSHFLASLKKRLANYALLDKHTEPGSKETL